MEYYDHEKPSVEASTQDHHDLHVKGLLQFRDLDSALTSLQKIDTLYRQYREVSDRVGTSLARELVTKSEQRAESMAVSVRLSPEKRREKREIAKWFKVWLEVPDLFLDWLEMRQKSREFQRKFPHFNGGPWHHAGKRSFSI
ncbi:MAG TPA: hypothetical protein VFJ52_00035 [Terriglobia bacterium]|nr:hypothetical protein [Terriglobia bacterium]